MRKDALTSQEAQLALPVCVTAFPSLSSTAWRELRVEEHDVKTEPSGASNKSLTSVDSDTRLVLAAPDSSRFASRPQYQPTQRKTALRCQGQHPQIQMPGQCIKKQEVAKCCQKTMPSTCCPPKGITFKDALRLDIKGEEKIFHADGNQKRTGRLYLYQTKQTSVEKL